MRAASESSAVRLNVRLSAHAEDALGEAWRDAGHPLNSNPGRDASPAGLDGYRRLAAAVLLTAVRDLYSPDVLTALDALEWLLFGDAPCFAENAGLETGPDEILAGLKSLSPKRKAKVFVYGDDSNNARGAAAGNLADTDPPRIDEIPGAAGCPAAPVYSTDRPGRQTAGCERASRPAGERGERCKA